MEKIRNKTPSCSWLSFAILNLIILFSMFIVGAAHATEFSVGNVTELIEAINSANDESNYPGPNTINMNRGTYTLTDVDNDTDGPNGLPSIISELTINGNDSTIERSEVKETPLFRIFHIDRTGRLLLNDLTISGGKATSGKATDRVRGGGLYNSGFLKLNTCKVKGNWAGSAAIIANVFGRGGGLYNHYGDVIIDSCGFSDNIATHGGGICNRSMMSISNSTINNNDGRLWAGGGIHNNGTLTITGSTISGNNGGGGIHNDGIPNYYATVSINSSTITGNRGVGLDASTRSPIEILNTIVRFNGDNLRGNCSRGGIRSLGYNLLLPSECGANSDLGDILSENPMLGPLSDNGGPTLTHPLLPGSPAIDAGDQANCPETDQRGYPRPVDGDSDGTIICDIGPYEVQQLMKSWNPSLLLLLF